MCWVCGFTLGKKWLRLAPSKAARRQAAFLEESAGPAWTEIISAQFLFQELVAVDDPHASSDVRFRRISSTPFAHRLERIPVRRSRGPAWDTSNSQMTIQHRSTREAGHLPLLKGSLPKMPGQPAISHRVFHPIFRSRPCCHRLARTHISSKCRFFSQPGHHNSDAETETRREGRNPYTAALPVPFDARSLWRD